MTGWSRTDIAFSSEGALLRGYLFLPDAEPPYPAVVMAHGTSATIHMTIDRYAEVFVKNGFAVLLYDHRNFGLSDGEPRQQINPWIQGRGYRDAFSFLAARPEISGDRVALWGFSYSGMEALVVGSLDERVRAVIAQCPVCGSEKPRVTASDALFQELKATFDSGDVSASIETTTGPLPVVSFCDLGPPSLLKGAQAFRWFVEYGGRHGSNWINAVSRVIPPTAAPFSPFMAAPYMRADLLMMVGRNDEMAHCNSEVARETHDRVPGYKEYAEIDGGHLGAMFYPSKEFDVVSSAQVEFLIRRIAGPDPHEKG